MVGQTDDGSGSGLKYLNLRSGDKPIDLHPPFSCKTFVYTAKMDFGMKSLQIDATPYVNSEITDTSSLTLNYAPTPGGSQRIAVPTKDKVIGKSVMYVVTVERGDGKDATVEAMAVTGGTFVPEFSPFVTDYKVKLPAVVDEIVLQLIPADGGQTIEMTSLESTDTAAKVPDKSEAAKAERLLTSIPTKRAGETQLEIVSHKFPIDVGYSRELQVKVIPANGDVTQALVYKFSVARAACPQESPFFAPDTSSCAGDCTVGYFPSFNARRCEACATNCRQCAAWDGCYVCEPSDYMKGRIVYLSDGFCKEISGIWSQLLLLGVAVSLLLCLCLVFCCCCRSKGACSCRQLTPHSDAKAYKKMKTRAPQKLPGYAEPGFVDSEASEGEDTASIFKEDEAVDVE